MDFPTEYLLALTALAAYLIGSVPFGIIIARIMGLGDLRAIGSGNIGATNVLRTGNKIAAGLTLLFDGGKGAGAVLLATILLGGDTILTATAAVMSVVGHCYPVWLGFRGGKGVATGIGVVIAMDLTAGFAMCIAWLAVAAIGRMSSLASLTAYAIAPVALFVSGGGDTAYAIGGGAVAVISWWRHRDNIARIIAGTEPKIGA